MSRSLIHTGGLGGLYRNDDFFDALFPPSLFYSRKFYEETDKEYILDVDLPGIPPELVEVKVLTNGKSVNLSVKADKEGSLFSLQKSLPFPTEIKEDETYCEYVHGRLTIHLVKKFAEQRGATVVPVKIK